MSYVSDQQYVVSGSTATTATLTPDKRASNDPRNAPTQIVITWATAAKKPAEFSKVGNDVRLRFED